MTLQSQILRLLAQPGVDRRLGRGHHYFPEAVKKAYTDKSQPPPGDHEITETLWALVARGLVYIDISQPAPENWTWRLTGAGQDSAKDEHFNPDDSERFLARLRTDAPDLPNLVELYMREAMLSFAARAYLASAVMLGVASEVALLEVSAAAATWLGRYGSKLAELLKKERTPLASISDALRRALEPHKHLLPEELSNGLTLTLDALADAIRLTRNDSGHPTGKTLSREDQYIALQMAGRFFVKLSLLTRFFKDPTSSRPS
jgi:hypothetical protein